MNKIILFNAHLKVLFILNLQHYFRKKAIYMRNSACLRLVDKMCIQTLSYSHINN